MILIKRKIFLYIVLFAIIIGGAPFFTGYLVETKFQDVMKVASESDSLNIEIVDYKRGWRKSYAKTRLTLRGIYLQKFIDALEKAQGPQVSRPKGSVLHVMLEHDIRHGPFVQQYDGNFKDWLFALATFHSKLFLTDQAKEVLTAHVGDPNLLRADGEITIEGAVKVLLEGKPIKVSADNSETVIWKGLNGHWNLSKDMKSIDSELIMPGFDFEWDNKHYFGQDLVLKLEQYKTPENLWVGNTTFNAQNLKVSDNQKNELWAFQALTAGSVTEVQSGMYAYASSLNIAKLNASNKSYGPLNSSFSIKNVNAKVARAFMDNLKRIPMAVDTVQQAAYFQNLTALIPEVLKTEPHFNVDSFTLNTPSGDFNAAIHLTLGGPNVKATDFTALLNSVRGDTTFSIPKSLFLELIRFQYENQAKVANDLAKQLNQKELTPAEIAIKVDQQVNAAINSYLQDNLIVANESHYVFQMQFTEGAWIKNGKPIQSILLPNGGVLVKPKTETPTQTPTTPALPVTPAPL